MRFILACSALLVMVTAQFHLQIAADDTKQKPVDPKQLDKIVAQLESKDYQQLRPALTELATLLTAHQGSEASFESVIEPLFKHAGWGGEARDDSEVAGNLIVRIGAPALPLLKQRLESRDGHDRRVAAELLVRIGPKDEALAALLIPLLPDRDNWVRKAAVEGLGAVGPRAKAAVDDLERLANRDSEPARRVGARIALIRVAGASDDRVRALASFLEMKDDLKDESDDEAKQTRKEIASYTASALVELGPKAKAAVPRLLTALKNPDVRAIAAHTLAEVDPNSPENLAVLLDLLKNGKSKEARRTAAGSLGKIGSPAKAAIPSLSAALKEDDKGGWWIAADALGKIGGEEVVPILSDALTSSDGDIRLTAMRALGNLGTLAKPAVEALEKAGKEDPRAGNRTAAAAALRKIELAGQKK